MNQAKYEAGLNLNRMQNESKKLQEKISDLRATLTKIEKQQQTVDELIAGYRLYIASMPDA